MVTRGKKILCDAVTQLNQEPALEGTGVLKATGYSGFITLQAPLSPSRLLRCCCSMHAPKVEHVDWLAGFIFLPELSLLYFFNSMSLIRAGA